MDEKLRIKLLSIFAIKFSNSPHILKVERTVEGGETRSTLRLSWQSGIRRIFTRSTGYRSSSCTFRTVVSWGTVQLLSGSRDPTRCHLTTRHCQQMNIFAKSTLLFYGLFMGLRRCKFWDYIQSLFEPLIGYHLRKFHKSSLISWTCVSPINFSSRSPL